ncbi:AIR carboxylase family protein [Klebsiella variicola subsp. variicola]|nr:AIR carboxylase family protein [Klebsiella variicola subsp. variicola]
MQFTAEILDALNVPYHVEVVSAHRTPDKLFSFAESAESHWLSGDYCRGRRRGASAGHDCGETPVPVLGVPVQSAALSGVDSLYSIVQMPRGIPVGTLAIGKLAQRTPACSPRRSLPSMMPNCTSA